MALTRSFVLNLISSLLIGMLAFPLTPTSANSSGPQAPSHQTAYGGFCDYFDARTPFVGWNWIDPLGDSNYQLDPQSGQLRISTPSGNHDLFINSNAPRLLQSFTGDFTIRTKVTLTAQFDYQGAGLIVWQDADHYLRLELGGAARSINYIHNLNGNYFDLNPDPLTGLTGAYLEITRVGNRFTTAYSLDGVTWYPLHSVNYAAPATLSAGLSLINSWQDHPTYADFDYFETGNCSAGKTLTRRILHVIYNPYLPAHQTHLLAYYNDPRTIAQQAMASFRDYSDGLVNYVVQEELEINDFPQRADGFKHTEASYFYCLEHEGSNNLACAENITVDYDRLIEQTGMCDRLNRGTIDEVWIDPPPRSGFYESALAGPKGFWYNGPTFSANSCRQLLPLMTFNYSREWDGGHAFGHRMEATMTEIYGGWTGNTPNPHNWEKFGMVKFESPDFTYTGCGSLHFTPNATSARNEYQFDTTTYTDSICGDFGNYPNLSNPQQVKTPINCAAWGCSEYGYYQWWFSHIPRQKGIGPDGKRNNWWIYFLDPDLAVYPQKDFLPIVKK